jgi:hypothetical protein
VRVRVLVELDVEEEATPEMLRQKGLKFVSDAINESKNMPYIVNVVSVELEGAKQ